MIIHPQLYCILGNGGRSLLIVACVAIAIWYYTNNFVFKSAGSTALCIKSGSNI